MVILAREGLGELIAEGRIVAGTDTHLAQSKRGDVDTLDSLKIQPSVQPSVILNAGGNYVEPTAGIAAQQQRAGAAPEATSAATSGTRNLGAHAG